MTHGILPTIARGIITHGDGIGVGVGDGMPSIPGGEAITGLVGGRITMVGAAGTTIGAHLIGEARHIGTDGVIGRPTPMEVADHSEGTTELTQTMVTTP